MIRRTIQALALMAVTGCGGHIGSVEDVPGTGAMERIYHNNGGLAALEYPKWVERAERNGTVGYIVDGPCVSFCVFLAFYSPHSCYTRSARLGIHLASSPWGGRSAKMEAFNAQLLAGIPPALAAEIRSVDNVTMLGGRDLVYEDLKRIMPDREC